MRVSTWGTMAFGLMASALAACGGDGMGGGYGSGGGSAAPAPTVSFSQPLGVGHR